MYPDASVHSINAQVQLFVSLFVITMLLGHQLFVTSPFKNVALVKFQLLVQ